MAARHLESRARRIGNRGAQGGQPVAQLLDAVGDFPGHRCHGIRGPKGNPIIRELRVSRGRKLELPAALHQRFGAGDNIQGQGQVLGAARQGAHHRDVGARQHARQGVTLLGHDIPGGLVAVDPAKMRRVANRSADIRAGFQRAEARSQRGRRAPRRTAGRPIGTPRVARGAIDFVVALKIGQIQGHIGLAQEDGARGLEARDAFRILRRQIVLELGQAPGRRQVGHVIGLLDRHGHAVEGAERPPFRKRLVRTIRRRPGAVEVAHHHRIDLSIKTLDAFDIEIGQLAGADLLVANFFGQFAGGREFD